MRLLLLLLHSLNLLPLSSSLQRNLTIDDTYGDELTGVSPRYNVDKSWPDSWNSLTQSNNNHGVKLDPSQVLNGTWHDGLVAKNGQTANGMNISVSFTGIAVYVIFALPAAQFAHSNNLHTDAEFHLDGQLISNFTYHQNVTLYNVTVFSMDSLENAKHNLVSAPGQTLQDPDPNFKNVFEFDYIVCGVPHFLAIKLHLNSRHIQVYTQEANPLPSHGTNVGAIVGGALGGLLFLSLPITYRVWRRYRPRSVDLPTVNEGITPWVQNEPVNNPIASDDLLSTSPPTTYTMSSDHSAMNDQTARQGHSVKTRNNLFLYERAPAHPVGTSLESPLSGQGNYDTDSGHIAPVSGTQGADMVGAIVTLKNQIQQLTERMEHLDEPRAPPGYES